jgi:hypothetical protein
VGALGQFDLVVWKVMWPMIFPWVAIRPLRSLSAISRGNREHVGSEAFGAGS